MTILEQMGQKAKEAARALAVAGAKKDAALLKMADAIEAHEAEILAANEKDLQAARESGMRKSMLDRLALTSARIAGMAQGVREVAAQEDPIGQVVSGFVRPNGLQIQRVRVPLGVIGIIYEARPNVTADAAALCLKAGNAVILRGGKEAIHSNTAVAEAMRQAVEEAGLPADCIQLVQDTTRASSIEMMGLTDYLDVLIPRGGAGLIRSVVENSHVPVIQTGVGNCHVYVDAAADLDKAVRIITNAKTSRPSVCNAEEVCLVHSAVAEKLLPMLHKALVADRIAAGQPPVELRLDRRAAAIISGTPASETDFDTEFLNYILAVAVVDSLDDAIAHIAAHSTHHSDCIVTEDAAAAARFTLQVDSAAVYVNVSTRFTDGGEFGLGCEMGISTQKLHARGPMGLDELSTYKYVVTGDGQIR